MYADKKLLLAAIQAAYQAGKGILEVYTSCADMEISYKSDDSPLTAADRKAHGIIRSALIPLGLPVLSEEGRSIAYEVRRDWDKFWLVDPLDGTKEFIKRNGEFTVNIALIQECSPVMGVIYVPVTDVMYFGLKDRGAFKIEEFASHANQILRADKMPEDKTKLLFLAAVKLPLKGRADQAFTVVGSRSHASQDLEDHIEELKKSHPDLDFISAGSSLKFCMVAEGKADQYPRLGPTMEWDTAAGQAIAESTGAEVVDHQTRQPLRYNKPSLLNPWFIVFKSRP